jgi:KAP-like P-loop domain-containing protein
MLPQMLSGPWDTGRVTAFISSVIHGVGLPGGCRSCRPVLGHDVKGPEGFGVGGCCFSCSVFAWPLTQREARLIVWLQGVAVAIPEDAVSTNGQPQTVFRAFERGEFQEWPAWRRLQRILESNGGSYGISGPRGAGKTWLMLRAIDETRHPMTSSSGIALWYPSPSEYDPLAFLASLSDALGNEVERRFRRPFALADRLGGRGMILALVGIVALGSLPVALLGWLDRIATLPVTLSVIAAVAFLGIAWRLSTGGKSSRAVILREAATLRSRARYTTTLRDSAEIGAEGGRWLVGKWRRSREQELMERPATLSSLVNDFRALAERAGELAGRVVIAIDELDKMDDPTKVKDLLRDVKGVFEVPHVFFLVSVSDEAARSLNLGALTGRSEFNSSFYTVIELPPVSPSGCELLLHSRSAIDLEVARVLAVLAGGNPREVVRLADSVFDDTTDPEQAVIRVLREEALNLRREIVTAPNVEGREPLGNEARMGAFRSLPDEAFADPYQFRGLGNSLPQLWEPPWADEGWTQAFGEAWRRLLIRLAVGGRLLDVLGADEDPFLQLRDVITSASESAAVARVIFEERLRIETRPAG